MMANDKIDQAIENLASAIKSQKLVMSNSFMFELVKKLPLRSLTGDHINGGKILNFSSEGIVDESTSCQLKVSDHAVTVKDLEVETIKKSVAVEENLTAKTITADIINASEIKCDIKFEKDQSIIFGGPKLYGKGLLWTGSGNTKQLVFQGNPDRFFCSENIDLAKNKTISINGSTVIDKESLGSTITKSSLKEVGKLKSLTVNGPVCINEHLFFNDSLDRIGIGTDQPNAALSVADHGVEVLVGSRSNRGLMGTFASHAIDIVTDNVARLSVSANGNIDLGCRTNSPISVSVHGTLGINVSTPDSRAKLDVDGAIKFNSCLHLRGDEPPRGGVFNLGDIVWNSNPQKKKHIGWVCISGGSPGLWAPFGEIK